MISRSYYYLHYQYLTIIFNRIKLTHHVTVGILHTCGKHLHDSIISREVCGVLKTCFTRHFLFKKCLWKASQVSGQVYVCMSGISIKPLSEIIWMDFVLHETDKLSLVMTMIHFYSFFVCLFVCSALFVCFCFCFFFYFYFF